MAYIRIDSSYVQNELDQTRLVEVYCSGPRLVWRSILARVFFSAASLSDQQSASQSRKYKKIGHTAPCNFPFHSHYYTVPYCTLLCHSPREIKCKTLLFLHPILILQNRLASTIISQHISASLSPFFPSIFIRKTGEKHTRLHLLIFPHTNFFLRLFQHTIIPRGALWCTHKSQRGLFTD